MSEKKEERTLPHKLVVDNAFMLLGTVASTALLPIFVYNCTRTMRHGRGLNMPRVINIFNPLTGNSCAMITDIACWQYGIPTHAMTLQWELRDEIIGLNYSFMVPASQHFYADVILRQWARKLPFMIDSPPVYGDSGQLSSQYEYMDYEPQGVKAKNKSVDMMLGHLLFRNFLASTVAVKNKEEVKIEKDSGKSVIRALPISKNSKPSLQFEPEIKKSKPRIQKERKLEARKSNKPKMGRTFS